MNLSADQVDAGRDLNLAVIGTGRWGQTLMRAISARKGLALTAVVSSKPVSVGHTAVPVFPDWCAAVDSLPIDGFVLALPPDIQPAFAEQIIAAGIPVFLEKPLALDRTAAGRLLAAARKSGFTGVVDHVHLFAPEFVELCRRLPANGGRAEIETVSGNDGPYRNRWTSCWDWAPHDIAMCLAVMKTVPNSVTARVVRSVERNSQTFENYEIGLDFGQCGLARITTGNAFDAHCREFRVQAGGISLTYAEAADRHRSLTVTRSGQAETIGVTSVPPLDAALGAFADRIHDSGGIEDLKRGALVVNICAAAHESVNRSAPVPVSES